MHIIYDVARWVIIIEFSLILIAIITTYLMRILLIIKNKRDRKLSQIIENYLISDCSNNKDIPSKWKKLDILLPITHQLDLKRNEPEWVEKRTEFVTSVMLPLARAATSSNDWEQRLFAAQSFAMLSNDNDEPYIIKLVSDKVPIIRYSALTAAILSGSEKAIRLIIIRMAKEYWLTQSLSLGKFDNALIKTRVLIEKRLKHTSSSRVKTTCYKLLLKYPAMKPSWDINTDINSKNMNLKISALKLLSYTDRQAAIPILIKSLEDTHWQVKTISLHCLGDLNAREAINKISKYLDNSNHWVSLSAAQPLYNLGEEGIEVLNHREFSLNLPSYNIVHHVLDVGS